MSAPTRWTDIAMCSRPSPGWTRVTCPLASTCTRSPDISVTTVLALSPRGAVVPDSPPDPVPSAPVRGVPADAEPAVRQVVSSTATMAAPVRLLFPRKAVPTFETLKSVAPPPAPW
ncbi:hypothetical protein GCM10010392_33770 [Streptomyces clavifer]|nr:hypothetical protein GCM10010392_33770 [Streptomyces clavifer]